MRKTICFLVALVLAAGMLIGALSVSAEGEATIILSKTVVSLKSGQISLQAKITGAATYETWIGIFALSNLDLDETDTKTLYQSKNSGWVYAQNKPADQLDTDYIVPDGTIVDLSTEVQINPKDMPVGTYRVVMFKDDNLSGQTNGFEVLATAEFELVEGSDFYSYSDLMGLAEAVGTNQLWFHAEDALFAQTFSADSAIQALNFPAWVVEEKGEIGITIYPYVDDDILASLEEEPVYDEIFNLRQGDVNLIKFDEPLAAGKYVISFQGRYIGNSTVLCVSELTDDDVETYMTGTLAGEGVPVVQQGGGVCLQLYTEKADAAEEVLNPDFGEQSSEPTDPSNPSDPEPPAETGDAQIAAVAFAIVVLLSAVIALTVRRKGEIG